MYISGPNFPRGLADAPPWARQALERFERVQEQRSGSILTIIVAGILAPKPGARRTDGMYLVPEGLVLVRKNRCAAISRSQIQEFRAISTSDGSGSSSESVVFTNDSAFRLVAGKHPELRARWEAWRTGTSAHGRARV